MTRHHILALAPALVVLALPADAGNLALLGAGGYAASGTSPSLKWSYSYTDQCCSAGGGVTSKATTFNGHSVAPGDLITYFFNLEDSSTAVGNHSMVCPSGYTKPTPSSGSNPAWSTAALSSVFCWKIAGSSETAPTFTWTTANDRYLSYNIIDWTGANTSTPIEDSSEADQNTNTQSQTALSLSGLTHSYDTLEAFYSLYAGDSTDPTSTPSGPMTLADSSGDGVFHSLALLPFYLKLSSSAATGNKTVGTGPAASSLGTASQSWEIAIRGLP